MSITISPLNTDKEDLYLNVSNSNFYALWFALFNEEPQEYGEVEADTLARALDGFKPMTIACGTVQDSNFISFGRTAEQVVRYYWTLRQIVKEAKKLDTKIIWG